MAGPAQIGGRIDSLITRINDRLNQPMSWPGAVFQDFCFVDEDIGAGTAEIAEYPMKVSAQEPKTKGDTDTRDFAEPAVWVLKCGSKRQDIFSELYPVSESRDPYRLFNRGAPDQVKMMNLYWQQLVANLLNQNPLAFDAAAFFGAHKANKAVMNSSDFSNDMPGVDLDEAGVTDAIERLATIPGANNQLSNADIGTPLIICPTKRLHRRALKLIREGTVAKAVGAVAAASEDAPYVGEANAIWMPHLVQPNVAATAKRWYVANVASAMHRPVIVRITARPRFEQDMQTLKTLRNSIAIYGWAEGDVALGLPHKMVRLQTP